MDNKLKLIPMGLVLALGLKAIVLGLSGADSAVAISLIGLLTLREYMEKNSKLEEVKEHTEKKLKEMSETISKQNEVIAAQTQEFVKLRDQMTAVKMTFGNREQSVANPFSKIGSK
jgi:uncharacterized coiled-coil protein SlyX